MRMRGILVVGAIMAVVLLLGTGFSGTVYAKDFTTANEIKTLKVSTPKWIKNKYSGKILSFTAGNTKYILHYKLIDLHKYTIWITSISKNGERYIVRYTIDYKEHRAWIDGREIKIKSVYTLERIEVKGTYTYRYDYYLKYIDDGNPNGGPIKYAHPYRPQPYWFDQDYSIGTWENELLTGQSLYHMQIGTDSIGWISELPGALAGAAIGALLGAYFGGGPIGAAIGAVIGAFIGFAVGNIIKRYVCDETGAGWQWINKHDVQEIIHAANSPWPWDHWVHIDYYKLGMLGPYSGWVYIP